MKLVRVLGGLHADEQRNGRVGVLVVDGRVGDAHQHHVVLADPRARYGRLNEDVEQDVSCRESERLDLSSQTSSCCSSFLIGQMCF